MILLHGLKHQEEVHKQIEFVVAHLINFAFFKSFKHDQSRLTEPRFILNTYHIVMYSSRGFFVTDYFLQREINSIFQPDCFLYLNEERKLYISNKLQESRSQFFGQMDSQKLQFQNPTPPKVLPRSHLAVHRSSSSMPSLKELMPK